MSELQAERMVYDEDRNLLALEKGGLYFDMWHLLSVLFVIFSWF